MGGSDTLGLGVPNPVKAVGAAGGPNSEVGFAASPVPGRLSGSLEAAFGTMLNGSEGAADGAEGSAGFVTPKVKVVVAGVFEASTGLANEKPVGLGTAGSGADCGGWDSDTGVGAADAVELGKAEVGALEPKPLNIDGGTGVALLSVAAGVSAAGALGTGAPNNEGAAATGASFLGALPNNENGSLGGAGAGDAGKGAKENVGGVAGAEVDFVNEDAKKLGTAEDAFPATL